MSGFKTDQEQVAFAELLVGKKERKKENSSKFQIATLGTTSSEKRSVSFPVTASY